MTDEQSQYYYGWFLGRIPVRIKELENLVRSTPGFESWKAEETPVSLEALGEWFVTAVKRRPRSQAEKEDILRTLDPLKPISIQDWTLTAESFSLSMDIAMYLATVMVRNLPGVHWERVTKPRRQVDVNQPVLFGFKVHTLVPMPPFPFNPVRMIQVLAYKLAEGREDGSSLRRMYDTWADRATENSG